MLISPTMQMNGLSGSVEGVRRKLRALIALIKDPGATEHERANAKALKTRLEQRLREAGAPAGDWTDNAFRLGRVLRRGYKRWSSD
jgi:hypothetical protein